MSTWTGTLPSLLSGDLTPSSEWVEIVNALHALTDSWSSYTPTWTTTGTAPALGNGTLTGKYLQAGKLICGVFQFTVGSTTTFGTGQWRFTVPTTYTNDQLLLSGMFYDVSSGESTQAGNIFGTTTGAPGTTVRLFAAGGALSSTVPFALATGDLLRVGFLYESA